MINKDIQCSSKYLIIIKSINQRIALYIVDYNQLFSYMQAPEEQKSDNS